MKKTLTAILALVLAQSALPRDIVATNSVDTIFTWHVEDLPDGGVEITGIDPKPVLEFEVPAAFSTETETYPVKRIGNGAFANAIGMTSVTLPSTLERIGDSAFANCTSLADVTIPYGVREIGKRPFLNTIITGLALPDSIIKLDGNIAAGALFDLGNALADSSHFLVTEDGAVYNRDQTRLYSCPTRTEGTLNLPESLTEIGTDAFFGCFRLTYLNIPANVSLIGEAAFNVSGLWPGLDAPESSAKLQNVYFEGSAPSAAEDIFSGAPETLVNYAFSDDPNWTNPWKGRPMTVIPDDAKPPVLAGKDEFGIIWYYRIREGFVEICNEDANGNPIAAISPKSTSGQTYEDKDLGLKQTALRIPKSINGFAVTKIGDSAFDGCEGLTSIGIPGSVTEIGDHAFRGCKALKSVDLWDNVPWETAQGHINLPYGVNKIGYHAFEGVQLQALSLPDTVTELCGNPAAGCANLTTIEVSSANPKFTVLDGVLYDKRKNILLAVPAVLNVTALSIAESVTKIGPEALSGCKNLDAVVLPEKLSAIGDLAFSGCNALFELLIPASVKAIGTAAFADCTALSQVVFDGSEPTAPDDIFNGSANVSVFGYAADGWSGSEWKGRPLTLLQGKHDPTVLSQTIGNVTWRYSLAPDGALIVGADGATGNVIIPRLLGGEPVQSVAPAAFDACRGITGFSVERGCITLMEKNGALYSADGKTLIRVPDAYRLEATVRTQTQHLTLTVTVVPAINPDGTDGTTYTTNSVGEKAKTSTVTIPSTVPVPTLLKDVTTIADHAFTGCGIIEGIGTTVTTNGAGVSMTGFIGDKVYVRTTYDITLTTLSHEEIVCVPENIACGDKAFDGSGVTEVRRTPVASIRLTAVTSMNGKAVAVTGGSDIRSTVGVPFSISLENMLPDGSSSASISAKGLPAGLKLVKHNDGSGNISYAIEGTPTKQVDGKAITLTAKKGNSLSGELTFALSLNPLPPEALGGFSGFITRPTNGDAFEDIGTFTLTTTEAGKITAKVITANGTTSFTASHWDSLSDSGLCSAHMTTSKGAILDISVNTKASWDAMQVSGTFSSGSISGNVTAQKNLFANSWAFTCTGNDTDGWILHTAKDAKSANLTVSVKANGATSISGKLGSSKVSASGTTNVSVLRNGILAADFVTFVKRGKTKQALSIRTDLRLDRQDPPEGVGRAEFTCAN